MTAPPEVPILRWGEPYQSLDRADVPACDGSVAGILHLANAGLIRRDLQRVGEASERARALPVSRWLEVCADAGERFLHDDLPVGDEVHGPDRYVELTSSTTGLPHVICRQHMRKVHTVLTGMERVLRGLTRGLDPRALLDGDSLASGFRFVPTGPALGVVLPSNAPGVNGVWLPALALQRPVLMKPGRADPWTPLRIMHALIAAGAPREIFGFYPCGHDGADVLLRKSGAGILFGGAQAAARYAGTPVEIHGPGRSKIVFGPDVADPTKHLDVVIDSVLPNAGRSCINTSTVVTSSGADALAEAIAARVGPIPARALDDPEAAIAAFADPASARAMDARIEAAIARGEATDVAADHRGGPRCVEVGGAVFLRPTVLRVAPDSPLANTELPFVFVTVVESGAGAAALAKQVSGSLVVTAITKDEALLAMLLADPSIDRVHAGPRPTTKIDWAEPHEGNLFELCYQRRAVAVAGAASSWEA